MATRLLHGDEVWQEIRALAEGAGKGCVAVAYLGRGASGRLPLTRGSTLVVDASEGAVKAGQTDPKELRKYLDCGVKVYRVQGLHAKVYIFQGTTIIGSPNVSRSSEEQLLEAAVLTDNRRMVRDAREFVYSLASDPISYATVDALEPLYVPSRGPKSPVGRKRKGTRQRLRRLWLMSTVLGDWDDATEQADAAGRPAAAAEIEDPSTYEVAAVKWYGHDSLTRDVGRDQQIIEFSRSGKRVKVYPPSDVVHVQQVRYPRGSRRSKTVIIYLARRKDVEPISWTEFQARARRGRLSLTKPANAREVKGDYAGGRLRSVWRSEV